MKTSRLLLPLLVFTVLVGGARAKSLGLPRMPVVEFAEQAQDGIAAAAVRAELERSLPPGQKLELSGPATAGASGVPATEAEIHTPTPSAIITGRFPVLDLSDERFGRIKFTFLPVLADWFESLAAALGHTPLELRDHGLLTNKVARLMAVFTTMRLDRQRGADRGYSPAIGWGRFHFNTTWGRCAAGSVHTLVVVGTDRGWMLFDPYTRRIRALRNEDTEIVPEFIVL